MCVLYKTSSKGVLKNVETLNNYTRSFRYLAVTSEKRRVLRLKKKKWIYFQKHVTPRAGLRFKLHRAISERTYYYNHRRHALGVYNNLCKATTRREVTNR